MSNFKQYFLKRTLPSLGGVALIAGMLIPENIYIKVTFAFISLVVIIYLILKDEENSRKRRSIAEKE